MGKPLWSDERITNQIPGDWPYFHSYMAVIRIIRNEYEARIAELEEQEVQHQISHQSYEEWEDEFVKKRKEYESNRNV